MTLTRARVLVEGVVQGVGYRAFVTQAARALRVNGIVRNLPYGRVEIFCDGDSASLDRFLDAINKKGDPQDFLNINVAKMQPFREGEEGFSWPDIRYEGFQIDYGMVQLSAIDSKLDKLNSIIQEFVRKYFER